jgi:hypothetical protein
MSDRLLANMQIAALEKLFDEKRSNGDMLTTLLVELSHRDTARSRSLKRRVAGALALAKPKFVTPASPYRMSPEHHRSLAKDLRRGEADWSDEERVAMAQLADAHDQVARAIERTLEKKRKDGAKDQA